MEVRGVCFILVLCSSLCTAPVSAGFVISEFCPDTWFSGEGDEYFIIGGSGDLTGYFVTDNEGSARFPDGTVSRGSVVVAQKSKDYEAVHGKKPDFELYDTDSQVPDMIRTGTLKMGNGGDELVLMRGFATVQEVSWPADVKSGEGRVHVYSGGIWDERPYYIGQSRFSSGIYYNVPVTVFVSPDCSYDVLKDLVRNSGSSLLVNVYEFTSPSIAGLFAEASGKGVDVEVLVEGSPVGGVPEEEEYLCRVLNSAGIPVLSMATENGVFHAPYRFDHAKYIVSDGSRVLITSENFGETGFPVSGTGGNRGWGAVAESPDLALYFETVFDWDTSGGWVDEMTGGFGEASYIIAEGETGRLRPEYFEGATITPVISPDTSNLVREMISGAKESVDIEQAYIKNWSSGENPWLEEAIDAARRGAEVRIILDSYYYNTEGENDNDEMAAYINSVASSESLPLEARLITLDSGYLEKVHNKGVIVDGELVLVSSINWNENSPSYNREAGLIIEHPGAAGYFRKVFVSDWDSSSAPDSPLQQSGSDADNKGSDNQLRNYIAGGFIVLFAAVYLFRRLRV
ncbi:MAG: phospholipase [Methanomicrobiaceae archaeon]|nr:phospholipase [Methanomicrobiaceae archaeon]